MVHLFKKIEEKNFIKEVESIKKNYTEILYPRDKIIEINNPVGRFNSRLDTEEKRISKLEDRWIENIQIEVQREKKDGQMLKFNLKDMWDMI